MTDIATAITSALNARREAMAPGPRSVADLARIVGLRASTLHLQLTGRRPMPAEVAAAMRRALPEIQDDRA